MGSDLKDQDQMPFFKQWWEKSSSLKTTKIVSKLGYNIKNIATIYTGSAAVCVQCSHPKIHPNK